MIKITDACLASLARRDWLTQGPLSDLTGPYIEALQAQHYPENTIRCLAHFSFWVKGQRRTSANINRQFIEHFIRNHLPICVCRRQGGSR